MIKKYDLVVIGSGPGGEKAAVKAAYFNHKVALIEKASKYGGTPIHQGLPAKILKETAFYLSGKLKKGLYGLEREQRERSSIQDFLHQADRLSEAGSKTTHENLINHKVDLYSGVASFKDDHHLLISGDQEVIYGENMIIATGSSDAWPSNLPFDGKRVHNTKSILQLNRFPKSLCITGFGPIGCELASIFSLMGQKLYILNRSDRILPNLDQDIVQFLIKQMAKEGVEFKFQEEIESIEVPSDDQQMLNVKLKSGKQLPVDMVLFAAGRTGNIKDLNLQNAGVKIGDRGTILVDEHYRTNVPHIYAVGDVIGWPALANTAMDQGRAAVSHIFKMHDLESLPTCFPYGIYSVPEVSWVGITEEEAKKQGIPYETGCAYYEDIPRGQIWGSQGLMKMIFNKQDQTVLGVHIVGHLATEIIHHGISLVDRKRTLIDVIGLVYNFPTLHELYKYAAYDGLSQLAGHRLKKRKSDESE